MVVFIILAVVLVVGVDKTAVGDVAAVVVVLLLLELGAPIIMRCCCEGLTLLRGPVLVGLLLVLL